MSDVAFERLDQKSLVMENSRAGIRELTFVLPKVVTAEEQLPVPAIWDMDAEHDVGLGAAPITAIDSIENHHCHVMPPWERKRQNLIDRLWRAFLGETLDRAHDPAQLQQLAVRQRATRRSARRPRRPGSR